jgi:hypothetical protein
MRQRSLPVKPATSTGKSVDSKTPSTDDVVDQEEPYHKMYTSIGLLITGPQWYMLALRDATNGGALSRSVAAPTWRALSASYHTTLPLLLPARTGSGCHSWSMTYTSPSLLAHRFSALMLYTAVLVACQAPSAELKKYA